MRARCYWRPGSRSPGWSTKRWPTAPSARSRARAARSSRRTSTPSLCLRLQGPGVTRQAGDARPALPPRHHHPGRREERLVDGLLEAPARLGLRHREPEVGPRDGGSGSRALASTTIGRSSGRPRAPRRSRELTGKRPDRELHPARRARSTDRGPHATTSSLRGTSARPSPPAPPPRARRAADKLARHHRRIRHPVLAADARAEDVVVRRPSTYEASTLSTGTPSSACSSRRSSSAARPSGRREEEVADLLEERRPELLEEADARLCQAHLGGSRELLADTAHGFRGRTRGDACAVGEDDVPRAELGEVVRNGGAGRPRPRYDDSSHASSSRFSSPGQRPQRRPHVLAHRDAALAEDVLRRRLEREPVEPGPQLPRDSFGQRDHRSGNTDASPETAPAAPSSRQRGPRRRRRRRGLRAGTAAPPRAACPRPSARRGSARARAGARPAHRHRIAAPRLELVDVERQRLARARRGREVRQQRLVVERVVRRPDDGDPRPRPTPPRARPARPSPRSSARRSARSPAARPASRKSSAARRRSAAGEQDPLAGRAEREDAVEATGREKAEVRPESLLVQGGAVVAEWRDGCRERSTQHASTLRFGSMAALRVERDGDVLRVTLARPERRNAFDAGADRAS